MDKQQFDFRVQGMTYVDCAQDVVHALDNVDGVEKAIVPGWQSARATVITDGCESKAVEKEKEGKAW